MIEILPTYLTVRFRMRRFDIQTLVGRCRAQDRSQLPTLSPTSTDAHRAALRLGHAVGQTLAVLPTDSRCLAARGIDSRLVIGAHSAPDFAAHAWVEYDGRPVLPTQGFDASRLLDL